MMISNEKNKDPLHLNFDTNKRKNYQFDLYFISFAVLTVPNVYSNVLYAYIRGENFVDVE